MGIPALGRRKALVSNGAGKNARTSYHLRIFIAHSFKNNRFRKTFASKVLRNEIKSVPLHSQNANAQMAESVDALVSNTSGATHPGSSPGLGTVDD